MHTWSIRVEDVVWNIEHGILFKAVWKVLLRPSTLEVSLNLYIQRHMMLLQKVGMCVASELEHGCLLSSEVY